MKHVMQLLCTRKKSRAKTNEGYFFNKKTYFTSASLIDFLIVRPALHAFHIDPLHNISSFAK